MEDKNKRISQICYWLNGQTKEKEQLHKVYTDLAGIISYIKNNPTAADDITDILQDFASGNRDREFMVNMDDPTTFNFDVPDCLCFVPMNN